MWGPNTGTCWLWGPPRKQTPSFFSLPPLPLSPAHKEKAWFEGGQPSPPASSAPAATCPASDAQWAAPAAAVRLARGCAQPSFQDSHAQCFGFRLSHSLCRQVHLGHCPCDAPPLLLSPCIPQKHPDCFCLLHCLPQTVPHFQYLQLPHSEPHSGRLCDGRLRGLFF